MALKMPSANSGSCTSDPADISRARSDERPHSKTATPRSSSWVDDPVEVHERLRDAHTGLSGLRKQRVVVQVMRKEMTIGGATSLPEKRLR